MKKLLLLLSLSVFIFTPNAEAQIGSRLKNKIKKAAEKRVEKRVDEGIEKGLDEIEEGAKEAVESKPENPSQPDQTQGSKKNEEVSIKPESKVDDGPKLEWARFDFVPGDKIIFEDGPSQDEENGEFPSRWDLIKGQIEIAKVDGEFVIAFLDGMPMIIPYLKDSDKDYLPDQFTIEFDIYRPADGNRFSLYLTDRKNQRNLPIQEIEITHDRISVGEVKSTYPGGKNRHEGRWMHIALAYTKGKLKVYMDDTRLINIPHYEKDPSGVSIECYFADITKNKVWYLKNFRIAEGGVKYYDRSLQEGKIVVNGIKFDVNKATLRPESMGPINKIFELMQENPDVKFSIEGHTDGDGEEDFNQQLSETRAQAVLKELLSLGISKDRLNSKGWGETKPISSNSTAEGKAMNRRVEFIRM